MMDLLQKVEIGPRWGHWLRQVWPKNATKEICKAFDVSPSTAQRWLSGAPPTTEYLTVAAKRWGKPFLMFVFGRLPKVSGDTLEHRLAIAERALTDAVKVLREVQNEQLGDRHRDRAGDALDPARQTPLGVGALPALKAS